MSGPDMSLNEYQAQAIVTWGEPSALPGELCCGLGIAGEAGEVADVIKKEFFHKHPRDPDKVAEELGDVLYYLSLTAHYYGFTLGEIGMLNNEKLADRYPNGFEAERSIHRNRNP